MSLKIRTSAVVFLAIISLVLVLYGSGAGWGIARAGFTDAGFTPDEQLVVLGFTVGIDAGDFNGDRDSAWESLSGGALGIEFGDSSVGTDQFHTSTPGHKYVTEVTLNGPVITGGPSTTGGSSAQIEGSYSIHENGAGNFRLEIDDMPVFSSNVESIDIEPLTIDIRDIATGADFDYRVYGPGDAHLGGLVISALRGSGSNSSEAYQWWLDTSQGESIVKDISVVAIKRDGSDGRRWNFFNCRPSVFHPFGGFSPTSNAGVETLDIGCERVEFAGSGRSELTVWLNDTTEGRPWQRTVVVTEVLKDGADGATYSYFDVFPVKYVFPSFSASGTGNLYEALSFKPIRLEIE